MLVDKFVKLTEKLWNNHLSNILFHLNSGMIEAPDGYRVLFPSILLITATKDHFLVELLGANDKLVKLTTKRHKEISTSRYLYQFPPPESRARILLHGRIRHLCISHVADLEELKKRFPTIRLFNASLQFSDRGIDEKVLDCNKETIFAHIDRCLVINRHDGYFRAKHILSLVIANKNIDKSTYVERMNELLSDQNIIGVHLCKDNSDSVFEAGQLQNLYLLPALRETTIGDYFKIHPSVIHKVFNTKKYEYEPYLDWIESPPHNTDKAINPDLMVQRSDGFYDIIDLKTAALMKSKLTKGERKRRRFIDYVNEGIAQLANYKEYFNYEKNCDHAYGKYGIKVKDPNLILVVGNYDNFDLQEVQEASRSIPKEFVIVDYDTIVQSLIAYSNENYNHVNNSV